MDDEYNRHGSAIIVGGIGMILALITFIYGTFLGKNTGRNSMEIEAVSHNYAEWIVEDDKRTFVWKEKEVSNNGN